MSAPGAGEPGHDDAGIFAYWLEMVKRAVAAHPVERPLIVEGRHDDEGQQQQPGNRQRPKREATPP